MSDNIHNPTIQSVNPDYILNNLIDNQNPISLQPTQQNPLSSSRVMNQNNYNQQLLQYQQHQQNQFWQNKYPRFQQNIPPHFIHYNQHKPLYLQHQHKPLYLQPQHNPLYLQPQHNPQYFIHQQRNNPQYLRQYIHPSHEILNYTKQSFVHPGYSFIEKYPIKSNNEFNYSNPIKKNIRFSNRRIRKDQIEVCKKKCTPFLKDEVISVYTNPWIDDYNTPIKSSEKNLEENTSNSHDIMKNKSNNTPTNRRWSVGGNKPTKPKATIGAATIPSITKANQLKAVKVNII
jgi:hypothetical protein